MPSTGHRQPTCPVAGQGECTAGKRVAQARQIRHRHGRDLSGWGLAGSWRRATPAVTSMLDAWPPIQNTALGQGPMTRSGDACAHVVPRASAMRLGRQAGSGDTSQHVRAAATLGMPDSSHCVTSCCSPTTRPMCSEETALCDFRRPAHGGLVTTSAGLQVISLVMASLDGAEVRHVVDQAHCAADRSVRGTDPASCLPARAVYGTKRLP